MVRQNQDFIATEVDVFNVRVMLTSKLPRRFGFSVLTELVEVCFDIFSRPMIVGV